MSRVLWKDGVRFDVVAPAGFAILAALRTIALSFPKAIVITAGTDGKHKKNSKHYIGEAYDIRSKDQTPAEQARFKAGLDAFLGPTKFYYFLEAPDTDNEHWHIQKRAGTVYTIYDYLEG